MGEFVVSFCFDPFDENGWQLATGGWQQAVRGKMMILPLIENWIDIRTAAGGWQLAADCSWKDDNSAINRKLD